MGEEYTFDQNSFNMPRVLVTDGTTVWQEEEVSQHYTTLSDTMNESYATAVDGENGTSQFFSVLETSTETILNDMSHMIDTSRENFTIHREEPAVEEAQEVNQEIMLFRVEGTDTMYGEQIAQDEDGNFQKYQFQVRQNEDGEFETIPETLQIVPFNDDEQLCLNEEPPQIHEEPTQESVFVKQEPVVNEDSVHSPPEEEENYDGAEIAIENIVIENNIEQENAVAEIEKQDVKDRQLFMKSEYENVDTEESISENSLVLKKEVEDMSAYQQMYFGDDGELIDSGDEEHEGEQLVELKVNDEVADNESILSHANLFCYAEEDHRDEVGQVVHDEEQEELAHEEEYLSENGEEIDHVEPIEEIHLEAEGDDVHIFIEDDRGMLYKNKMLELAEEPVKNTALKNINRIVRNNNKAQSLLMIEEVEKENVSGIKNYTVTKKPHPRSLLKSSIGEQVQEKPEFDKRFAKGKVAAQARQLQNFISATKILEVPARTERLPRKQKIKPLVRSGEEIVVQEVVVSSDGFVNTLEDGVLRERKMLETTDYIHLSDSEDDTVKKKKKRKQKKNENDLPIVISDSDSEEPVVEPRKLPYKCTKCEKSFPSEGGLNTHMQYHNYSEVKEDEKYSCDKCEESFESTALLNKHMSEHVEEAGKFKCKLCDKSFKENIALMIHRRIHTKDKMFKTTTSAINSPKKPRRTSTLPIPKKTCFPQITKKRISTLPHLKKPTDLKKSTLETKKTTGEIKKPAEVKKPSELKKPTAMFKKPLATEYKYKCLECNETFVNNVLLTRHSANHKKSEQSSNKKRSSPNKPLKCKECGKTFSTSLLLTSHEKTHKRFACKNCKQQFASNILLQNHVLKNCVKSPARKFGSLRMQLKCDECEDVLPNYTAFLEHKVLVHKLQTPDKSVGNSAKRKTLYTARQVYSGIPINKKMNEAFNKFRTQLNMNQD